jgi:hypothetical protein
MGKVLLDVIKGLSGDDHELSFNVWNLLMTFDANYLDVLFWVF